MKKLKIRDILPTNLTTNVIPNDFWARRKDFEIILRDICKD